jgi:CRISPR-associated endonuclease/helicase Cas3
VSIGEAAKFLNKNQDRAWQWNFLDEAWQKADHARPGAVYLIDASAGGYDDDLGWTGDPKSRPTPHLPGSGDTDSQGKDGLTFGRYWLSLDEHTQGVVNTMSTLAAALSLDAALTAMFRTAASWHDTGKAHAEFQKALRFGPVKPEDAGALYAKSKNPYDRKAMNGARRGFRHELASALGWLSAGPADAPERDLVAYLIAAHHGKVRLSIRALPDEKGNPDRPDVLFARGIWNEDTLPAIPGLTLRPLTIDMRVMQMGEGEYGPSWLARMIALRDRLGPFRLAYLETLLRAADMRTSRDEAANHQP